MKKNQSAEKSTLMQPMAAIPPTLRVNSKEIVMTYADGRWWVAVKPICDVLNVDYHQQFKNLKDDEIVGQLLCNHTTTGADSKQYKMVCIPEHYVYGWIFSIQSKSPELLMYKRECYDVLFNHFHGAIVLRTEVLKEKSENQRRIETLKTVISEIPEVKELKQRMKAESIHAARLKRIDSDYVKQQLPLWSAENEKEVANA